MKLIILIVLFIKLLIPFQLELNTPQKISNFMVNNIKYNLDLEELMGGDYFQSPKQTIKLKSGDCDDMAILSDYLLTKSGYKSDIYFIFYSNRKGGHAITVFKQGKYYNIFSNQYLIKTYKTNIIKAIKYKYRYVKEIFRAEINEYGWTKHKAAYFKVR